MFCVVETIEKSGRVSTVVPSNWITQNMLSWPPATGNKLKKIRENRTKPEDDWIKIPVNRVLFDNICEYIFYSSNLYYSFCGMVSFFFV